MKRRAILATLPLFTALPILASRPAPAAPTQAIAPSASSLTTPSAFPVSSAAAALEQILWLKNGAIMRGALVEFIPDQHVTLQLLTGELKQVPWSSVLRASWLNQAPSPTTPPSASAPPAPSASSPFTFITLNTDRPNLRLESRPLRSNDAWQLACESPCSREVLTNDRELRISGPETRPSRPFLAKPSTQGLRLIVRSGSPTSYQTGQVGLLAGTVLGLLGAASYGVGQVQDSKGLEVTGIVTMSTAALAVLIALPLIASGSTTVRDSQGNSVASQPLRYWTF